MKTQSMLSLANRIIKLNVGHRLRLEIQTKVNEASIKSGTTAAYKRVSNVG